MELVKDFFRWVATAVAGSWVFRNGRSIERTLNDSAEVRYLSSKCQKLSRGIIKDCTPTWSCGLYRRDAYGSGTLISELGRDVTLPHVYKKLKLVRQLDINGPGVWRVWAPFSTTVDSARELAVEQQHSLAVADWYCSWMLVLVYCGKVRWYSVEAGTQEYVVTTTSQCLRVCRKGRVNVMSVDGSGASGGGRCLGCCWGAWRRRRPLVCIKPLGCSRRPKESRVLRVLASYGARTALPTACPYQRGAGGLAPPVGDGACVVITGLPGYLSLVALAQGYNISGASCPLGWPRLSLWLATFQAALSLKLAGFSGGGGNVETHGFFQALRASLGRADDVTGLKLRLAGCRREEHMRHRHVESLSMQLSFTRYFHSLKMWFMLKRTGVEGIQLYVRKSVQLCQLFVCWVCEDCRFEMCVPSRLGMAVFRLKGDNCLTKQLLSRLNNVGEIYCSPATLRETSAIRKAVGSLLYLSTTTKPDIAYAVCKVSQSSCDPTKTDWQDVKHIMLYLKKTQNLKLTFVSTGGHVDLFCEVVFANGKDRKSVSGYVATLANAPVSWKTRLPKKRDPVATSTTEAEYASMFHAAKEELRLKQIVAELDGKQSTQTSRRQEKTKQVECASKEKILLAQREGKKHRRGGVSSDSLQEGG
ncbi:hypothetical protein PR048_000712 [Dryococelus australis]|uniref:Uncharacterized protein n=1 Tax=Dryococelus australis TaxID=614101 RepID=A0ABQ9IFD8_9NEOP|nr:hypothetical protein PR048_000712 [Dryococelus australis]